MFRYVIVWDDGPSTYSSIMIRARKWLSLEELKFLVHVHLQDAQAEGHFHGKTEDNFRKVEIYID